MPAVRKLHGFQDVILATPCCMSSTTRGGRGWGRALKHDGLSFPHGVLRKGSIVLWCALSLDFKKPLVLQTPVVNHASENPAAAGLDASQPIRSVFTFALGPPAPFHC